VKTNPLRFLCLLSLLWPFLLPAQTLIDDLQLGGASNQVNSGATFTVVSGGTIVFASGSTITFGDPLSLANGGLGVVLTDPNADRISFWDDSAGSFAWLTVGSGLTLTDTTLTADLTSAAPTDATYITQTANGTLSAEQALSSLSTGIMRVATTTGVLTSLTDSAGIAANISDETGSGALVFGTSPDFTTGITIGSVAVPTISSTSTLTNKTIDLTSNTLTATSAQLITAITDESGTGVALFGTSPTITTPTISGAIALPDGVRQTFNPDGTNAGLNVGSHTADPSAPSNGDLWYDSTANELTARINGANVALGAGGGGDITTDAAWAAAGDLIVATGNDTAAVVSIGTAGQVFTVNSGATAPEWTSATSIIAQNSKSADYTLVLADAGKHIFHPSADTTPRTWTIPANASVAYPLGTVLTFVNQDSAGDITIAITSDTLTLAGAGTTGSLTLTENGIATAIKITSTDWLINGTNLAP
jgi:hypothetical protein